MVDSGNYSPDDMKARKMTDKITQAKAVKKPNSNKKMGGFELAPLYAAVRSSLDK